MLWFNERVIIAWDYLDWSRHRKANFLRQMADAPAGSKLESINYSGRSV